MKILAIGDFHGKFPEKLRKVAKKVDVILCTGDLGGNDKLLKVVFKSLVTGKWWEAVGHEKAKQYVLEDYNSGKKIINELASLGKPVYIISGNWDFISKREYERTARLNLIMYPKPIEKKGNLFYWKRGFKTINGMKVLAFGGYVTAGTYLQKGIFDEKKIKKHVIRNKRERKQLMYYGRRGLDVLFIHYPPYGYFDVVKFKGYNPMKGKHIGFIGYTEFIRKYQPKLVICGHMHEYQGMKKLGRTKIIATGAAKDGKAVIIDFDEKKGKIKNVRFLR